MNNRKNAYTEVYTVLKDLNEEEFNKIPHEVIKAIEENRNLEYKFELDDNLQLKEHQLLPETKAILFNVFRDYLSTPEQKEKIIKMQNEGRKKNELKKQEMYNSNVFNNPNKKDPIIEDFQEKKLELIKYKEPFFVKILKKIKSIFYKK